MELINSIIEYVISNGIVANLKSEGYLYLTVLAFIFFFSILLSNIVALIISGVLELIIRWKSGKIN